MVLRGRFRSVFQFKGSHMIDLSQSTDVTPPWTGGFGPWSVANAPAGYETLYYGVTFTGTALAFRGPGWYIMTLDFIEPTQTVVGARKFSVSVNSQPILVALDLVKRAGPLTPYQFSFPAITEDGKFVLDFTTSFRSAVISRVYLSLVR